MNFPMSFEDFKAAFEAPDPRDDRVDYVRYANVRELMTHIEHFSHLKALSGDDSDMPYLETLQTTNLVATDDGEELNEGVELSVLVYGGLRLGCELVYKQVRIEQSTTIDLASWARPYALKTLVDLYKLYRLRALLPSCHALIAPPLLHPVPPLDDDDLLDVRVAECYFTIPVEER